MMDVRRLAAFSDTCDGGNPAGVVFTTDELTFCEMQRMAADLGHSETAFLVPAVTDSYRARFFGPVTEVTPLGHGSLAATVAVADRSPGQTGLTLLTSAGPVPAAIHRTSTGVWAELTWLSPRSRPTLSHVLEQLLDCFGWSRAELDGDLPPVEVHAGGVHMLCAVGSADHLHAMAYDPERLRELMWNRSWSSVSVVRRDGHATYHTRTLRAAGEVEEEPAAGVVAAALGEYLRELGLTDEFGMVTVLQGADIGRPSKIIIEAAPGEMLVRIRGRAVMLPDQSSGLPGRAPDAASLPVGT